MAILLENKNWSNGLHVKEKVKLLNSHAPYTKKERFDPIKSLKNWRENCLLVNDTLFQKRLEAEGMTLKELEEVLSHNFTTETEQPWVSTFKKMMKEVTTDSLRNQTYTYNLYYGLHPFLQWAEKQLALLFKDPFFKKITNEQTLRDSWVHSLAAHLLQSSARAFALEVNYARLLEELKGETPEERYLDFIESRLKSVDYLHSFYGEYITLARLMTTRTIFFVQHVKEAVDRFKNDYKEIHSFFNIKSLPKLINMNMGVGDSHQQGRSVIQFEFDGLTLMYKPKPLSIANDVQHIFQWVNLKGFSQPLKTYKGLDKQTYMWEEKVQQKPVHSKEELERYYSRLGGLLAIMYLLKTTDLHYENIIANGEYPIIIDFETVFSNMIKGVFKDSANTQSKLEIAQSVIGTGLLPTLGFQAKDGTGVELSGMGGKEQELPFLVLQVENEHTDEIRFVQKPYKLKESGNLAKLNGKIVNPSDYMKNVISGFKEMSTLIIENKEAFLSEDGPLAAMKEKVIRIVVRDTNYYSNFVFESTHPDFLRNSMDRENILDRVFFTPIPPSIVMSEKLDLLDGDVPYFTTKPNSLHLYDSRGVVLPNVFNKTAYELVRERIIGYDQKEVDKQVRYITGSMIGYTSESSYQVKRDLTNKMLVDKQDYLETAIEIGNKLLDDAIWGPDKQTVSWIGMNRNYKGQWSFSALEPGLYSGVIGIGLFFAHLASITEEEKYYKVVKAVIETVLENTKVASAFPSVFYGPVSILYPLFQLKEHFYHEPTLIEQIDKKIHELVTYLDAHVEEDKHFDLLGGSAGVIHVLLSMYEQNNKQLYMQIAQKYVQYLIAHATTLKNDKISWVTPFAKKGLGGFGHGASGIASALLRFYAMSGHEEAKQYGDFAFTFDRSLFNPIEGKWKDNRDDDDTYKGYWCHGYVGIGFSRLLLKQFMEKDLIEEDISQAIKLTMKENITDNHSLCHGDMGACDFLLTAGNMYQQQDVIEKAHLIASRVTKEIKEGKYLSGAIQQIETPGMFLGLSGIGYQVLRMYDSKRVPSILLMK